MILITGGTGQLGSCLEKHLRNKTLDIAALSHKQMDVSKKEEVDTFFDAYSPEVVIHCAAYSKVDQAERNIRACRSSNVYGTQNIAEACLKHGSYMLYISSDYVFDGTKKTAYETEDPVSPLSVYGQSKADGEALTLKTCTNSAVLRTSWLFGEAGNNFVETILKLAEKQKTIRVVSDQVGSPTYTVDLATLIEAMIFRKAHGIFHGTNEGLCSWAEFAEQILVYGKRENYIEHISSAEYASPAVRPLNSRLSKRNLDQAGFSRLPDWKDALQRYMHNRENQAE